MPIIVRKCNLCCLDLNKKSGNPAFLGPHTPIRLLDGNTTSGRVEINYDGTWGTICHDDFSDREATVLCRMLGYSKG